MAVVAAGVPPLSETRSVSSVNHVGLRSLKSCALHWYVRRQGERTRVVVLIGTVLLGGNSLDKAPAGRVKDFVQAHGGHTVITKVGTAHVFTSWAIDGVAEGVALFP